ncbi:hypothetical protein [Streptococcus thoraltensis]|uniref:hypothetical protein n=1 Tax=Streptococcus thoraltensis TaxID=55085 RepID=UPI001F5AF975|nr:hypothetical protein [Streptococcus thoraltensis]
MTHYTYKDFLTEKDALSFEEYQQLHKTLLVNVSENDRDFHDYWTDFVSAAVAYAAVRGSWWLMTRNE